MRRTWIAGGAVLLVGVLVAVLAWSGLLPAGAAEPTRSRLMSAEPRTRVYPG